MSEDKTMCPVMKIPVDTEKAVESGLTSEYDGRVFYFCCPGCKVKFDEDSEKYISGLSDEKPHSGGGGCGGCC